MCIAAAKAQAMVEAQKILEEAKVRIAEEKEDALRDMRREVAMLSLAVSEQVLRKELGTDEGQKQLIEKLVDEMSGTVK